MVGIGTNSRSLASVENSSVTQIYGVQAEYMCSRSHMKGGNDSISGWKCFCTEYLVRGRLLRS